MSTPATFHDVAEKAGVHRSTVSFALRDNRRISEEVRRRILRIARELGLSLELSRVGAHARATQSRHRAT